MGDLGGNPLKAPVDVSVHQLNLLGGVGGGLQFGAELFAEHRLEELHPRGNPGRVSEEVGADNELQSMRRLQGTLLAAKKILEIRCSIRVLLAGGGFMLSRSPMTDSRRGKKASTRVFKCTRSSSIVY